jgi:hypothetical protein
VIRARRESLLWREKPSSPKVAFGVIPNTCSADDRSRRILLKKSASVFL